MTLSWLYGKREHSPKVRLRLRREWPWTKVGFCLTVVIASAIIAWQGYQLIWPARDPRLIYVSSAEAQEWYGRTLARLEAHETMIGELLTVQREFLALAKQRRSWELAAMDGKRHPDLDLIIENAYRIVQPRHIPLDAVKNLAWAESNYRIGEVSRAGAIGLFGVKPDTAREMGFTAEEMFDPCKNSLAGIGYWDKKARECGGLRCGLERYGTIVERVMK